MLIWRSVCFEVVLWSTVWATLDSRRDIYTPVTTITFRALTLQQEHRTMEIVYVVCTV